MADIAAANVTVTVNERQIVSKKRRNRVTIAFGDGVLTYPAGGVPMPAFGSFGMKRNLDYLTVFDEDDSKGVVYKYDRDNNKIRAYVQGYAHGTGGAVTVDDYPVNAAEGVTTGISVSLTTGAGAVTDRLGGLVEMAGGVSLPSATTLQAEAVGW